MQFEVNDLISKIKKDGLEEAEKVSSEIISKAKHEAETIILNSKHEAETIVRKAEKDSEEYKKNALDASKQAVRDLLIGTEKDMKNIFESILKDTVSKTMNDKLLSDLILKVVNSFVSGEKLEILVNESDISSIKSILASKLESTNNGKIEINPFKGIEKGFKIQLKDSNLYYDFTVDTISEVLFEYLNPRFKDVMKK